MKDKRRFSFSKLSSGKLRSKAERLAERKRKTASEVARLTFIEIAASEHAGIDNAETESRERRRRDGFHRNSRSEVELVIISSTNLSRENKKQKVPEIILRHLYQLSRILNRKQKPESKIRKSKSEI